MSNNRTLTASEIRKLKEIVDLGVKQAQEIKDLKESFRDTLKNVSEELDMPAKDIRRAIQVAIKESIEDEKESVNTTEEILAMVGRA
jgi:biopolymer transport protein ExbB/TolQ